MLKVIKKRAEKRFECNSPLSFRFTDFGKAHSAKALNWSEGGIAFETDRVLQVGTIIFIKKEGCYGSEKLHPDCLFLRTSSFATVKWVCGSGANGSSGYVIGAENFVYGCFY